MAEAIERVENRAVRRAEKLLAAAIIIDRHSRVGAGSFAGDEIAVAQVNEQAALRDAGIIQQASRVDRHLLGVGAQLLLSERLIGKSARRLPHENRVGKVHITSINVLLSSVVARIPVLAL